MILEETDSVKEIIVKMCEGNPGAINVLTQLYLENANIDPDSYLAHFGAIVGLDEVGIHGHRIWMLYKDVCRENIILTVAVLRAEQLGFISREQLNYAIDNRGDCINVHNLYKQVCKRLPNFRKGAI